MRTAVAILIGGAVLVGCERTAAPGEEEVVASDGGTRGAQVEVMDAKALRTARTQAGFKSSEQRNAEEAAQVELLARRQVRRQIDAYRGFVRHFERVLSRLERSSARLQDPQAYDRFRRGYARLRRGLEQRFGALESGEGPRGMTFQSAERLYRSWEDLNTGLEPMPESTERFDQIVAALRADLAALGASLDEIERDERLSLPVTDRH